jgi:membrane protein required for colicin V production
VKIIDIVILLLVLFGAYRGFKKGLLIEIISFLALIIAIISAIKLTHSGIIYFFGQTSTTSKWIPFLVFLLIFLLVFFGIFLLGKLLKKILDYTLLGQFDNLVGAILGATKVAFGISLLLWLMYYTNINFPQNITTDSIIYPQCLSFAPTVVKWISHVIPFQDIFPSVQKTLNG